MSGMVLAGAPLAKLRDLAGVADGADAATILGGLAARSAALPAGQVLIAEVELEQLQVDAAARASESDRRMVAAAVADGRIPRARMSFWLHQLATDPSSAATLNSLVSVTPPTPDPAADDGDAVYAALFPEEAVRG